MAITQVTKATHVAEAQSRLVEQFKAKANFLALIRAFINQVADIETAAFQVLNETTLAASVGAQLDGIGEIVGEERLGRSDAEYRQAISARILINLGSSTPEDIIEIFNAIETSAAVELIEYPPASFVMTLLDAVTAEPDVLLRALRTSRPAGVATSLVYSLTAFPFLLGPAYATSEKLTNGSFSAWTGDNPDSWTTIESGTSEVTERGSGQGHSGSGTGAANFFRTASGSAFIQQTFTTIPGHTYRMTVTVSFDGGGDLFVSPNPTDFPIELIDAVGTHIIEWTATSTSQNFAFGAQSVGTDMTVDSISVVDIDEVTIDSDFSLGRASPLDNGSFRVWTTGDDPVFWTVFEAGTSDVTERAFNEGNAGSGTGACNLYKPGTDVCAIRQALTDSLIVGHQYEIRIDIGYAASGSSLFVDDSDTGSQFTANISNLIANTTRVVPFIATQASAILDIAPNPSSDITIGNVRIVDVGIVQNGELERWTGGNPDWWTTQEVPPFSEVKEVGSGEDSNGAGSGAANLWSAGGTGGQYVASVYKQSIAVTPGAEYILRIKVSNVAAGSCFYGIDNGATAGGVTTQPGIFQLKFTPTASTIDVGFSGTDDLVTFVVAAHDFTVDWIEVVQLNTDTRGLLATAVE